MLGHDNEDYKGRKQSASGIDPEKYANRVNEPGTAMWDAIMLDTQDYCRGCEPPGSVEVSFRRLRKAGIQCGRLQPTRSESMRGLLLWEVVVVPLAFCLHSSSTESPLK